MIVQTKGIIHHKELEQLKDILSWKAAAIKVSVKYKKTIK